MAKRIGAIVLVALLAVGIIAGSWLAFGTPDPVVEAPSVAIRSDDGALTLAREITTPTAKPAHKVPGTAKVERIVQARLKPTASPADVLTVDLTLWRQGDGAKRVTVSSPDGEIVGGIDVPVETSAQPPAFTWSAGISLDPFHQTAGVWMTRDWRRVRVGVEANEVVGNGVRGIETRVLVGWRW